jgi:predicted phage tail protein
MIRLVYVKNQLKIKDNNIHDIAWVDGKTVRYYLDKADIDVTENLIITSARHGKLYPDDKVISANDELTVINVINGPVIGYLVQAIVVAIVQFAVSYAMNLAINAIFGTEPKTSTGGNGLDEGQTYSWDGIRTRNDIGVPVPIIYGEHKVGGNIINCHLTNDGDKNYLNMLIALCEGEIESISDIRVDDNPYTNYTGITTATALGTNTDTIIPNFEDLATTYNETQTLLKDTPYVYTTSGDDIEAFELHLKFNGLFQQSQSTGSIKSWNVSLLVEYKIHTDGSYTELGTTTFSAKTRNQITRSISKTGLTAGQYDIRITRTSNDSDFYHTGDVTLYAVEEIVTDDLIYPNTAKLGIKALATNQLSGQAPNITCVVQGLKIYAPNIENSGTTVDWEDYYYDEDTSEYKLIADDTVLTMDGYTTQYCGNPIWCLRDLLTNGRYGLGEYIQTTDMSDASLLEMSKHCEELVPNGLGGFEKRFRLDVVIDSATSALDVIRQVAGTFRGLPFYSGGEVKFRIDKAEAPTQLFGMGNIIAGSFQQQWKPINEVYNVVDVQFLDKDKNYEFETISVVDEEAIADGEQLRRKSVRLFTTRMGYALREGRYALKFAKYINEIITFKASIDALSSQAGDVIAVCHDVPAWGYSGRIVSATANTVTLDRAVTIQAGYTNTVMIRHSDDTIETKNITTGIGEHTTVTIDGTFATTPSEYEVYAIGIQNVSVKNYRIMGIKVDEKHEVSITAQEYNEGVYDDSAITLPSDNYTMLSMEIPEITTVNLSEQLVKKQDGTIENTIIVDFVKPALTDYSVNGFESANIYLSDDDGVSYRLVGNTRTDSFLISDGIGSGETYYVKVSSLTAMGQENDVDSLTAYNITVLGKSASPTDVSSFLVNQSRDRLVMSWGAITDVDVWGYEIRCGNSWLDSSHVAFVEGTSYLTTNFREGTGQSYWIKAVDTSGNYSGTEKEAVLTVDNIPFRNIVQSYSEQTAWSGTKSNTETDGNYLQITTGNLTGTYVTAVRDIGYSASFYIGIEVITSIAVARSWDDDETTTWASDSEARFSGVETSGNATFEIKTSHDNSTWTDWMAWQSGDYSCRYFQLRMTLTRENVTDDLECSQFDYYADLPDVDETGSDSDAGGDGEEIVFTKEYHVEPNVHIEILSGSAIYHRFTEKDLTGFTVAFYDATGTQQPASFDWHSHGI